MTDHDLDLQLRAWYRSELDRVAAPTGLRDTVARIPAEVRPPAVGIGSRRTMLLVAATLAILTIAALIAVSAGWLPRRDAITPPPAPSLAIPSPSSAVTSAETPNTTTADAIEMVTTTVATFEEPVDLVAIAEGPGGAPFVIDRAAGAVVRIDPNDESATTILRAGDRIDGTVIGTPQVMTDGGERLLVLDDRGALWGWRADDGVRGTLERLILAGDPITHGDVAVAGTFCRDEPVCRFSNLYLVDPSDQMIWVYAPAADGTGYPAPPSAWLRAPRDVGGSTSLLVDGDLYLAHRGEIVRFTAGDVRAWAPAGQESPTSYVYLTTLREITTLFAFDAARGHIVSIVKSDGQIRRTWTSRVGDPDIGRLRGMAVGRTFWWIDGSAVYRSSLRSPDDDPAASPLPSGTG